MFGTLDVPTIPEAKKRVDRRNTFFIGLSSIFTFFLLFLLYLIVYDYMVTGENLSTVSLWIIVTLFLFALFIFLGKKILILLENRWESLDDLQDDKKIGGFKIEKIKKMTEDISSEMDIEGRKVQVCTVDATIPNAFGLLWRNVICLDKSWLRLLNEQELKALISHELYHLKLKKTRPFLSHPLMTKFVFFLQISVITALFFFVDIGRLLWVVPFSIIVFQSIDVLFFIAPLKSSRAEEHLCDWSALEYAGIIGSINLMLKLGQRYEDMKYIKLAVSEEAKEYSIPLKDHQLIKKRIDKNIERDKMDPVSIRETVKRTMDELADERDWKEPLIRLPTWGLKKRMNRATKKHKIDWLQYDRHHIDFKLDMEELPDFIEAIKSDRKSFLFDAPVDSHRDSHGAHPTIKQRVLFLWNNYNREIGDPT